MNVINKFGLINDDIYYCQDRRMIFCLEIAIINASFWPFGLQI